MGQNARQQRAIAALIETGTIKEAAEVAGIGQATIFRWMQDPQFRRSYRQARSRLVELAISQVQKACGEAVLVLQGIMNNEKLSPGPRVNSAKAILDFAMKGAELEDLKERIEKLEEKLKL
jgi:hypothetical protein